MDPQDPKSMSDEELDAAIQGDNSNPNEDGGNPVETPPVQEEQGVNRGPDGRFQPKQTEEQEPEGDPAEQEPQHQPDEEKPPSRREQLRVQQLLERVKQGQSRPQGQEPQPRSQRQGAIDYAQELDADPEVIQRLEEDRRLAENARFREGQELAAGYEWRTLLQVDAPTVAREHPELNERSPEFHPALSNSLSEMYLQMSGFDKETGLARNPGMRWSDFIESFWELADEISNLKVQQTTAEVAKQAAQTGIRPDGGSANKLNLNKAPEHMSDAGIGRLLSHPRLATDKTLVLQPIKKTK
jgi:hypothetical protein